MMNRIKKALVKLLAVALMLQPLTGVVVNAESADQGAAVVSSNQATVSMNKKILNVTTSLEGVSEFTVNANVKVQLPQGTTYKVTANNSGLADKKVVKSNKKNVYMFKAVKNVPVYCVALSTEDGKSDFVVTVINPSFNKDYKKIAVYSGAVTTDLNGNTVSENSFEYVTVSLNAVVGLSVSDNAIKDIDFVVNAGKAGKEAAKVYNNGDGTLTVVPVTDAKGKVKITATLYGKKYTTVIKVVNKYKFSKKAAELRKQYVSMQNL